MHPPVSFIKESCIGCGACANVCNPRVTDSTACTGCGRCAEICFAGALARPCRELGVDALFTLIATDKPYFDNGGGGVTFSGGECMLQPDFLSAMVEKCKANGIHTAIDTAGHVPYEWLARANPDLFLYDIKAASPDTHKALTGVDGLLIWENLARLVEAPFPVHVRIPCIPGANWEEIPAIIKRLKKLGVTKIEPLPYHRLGEGKAAWFNQEARVYEVPSESEMQKIMNEVPL